MVKQPPRLGVDIGGTFTDIVLEVDGRMMSSKVLTCHVAPEKPIIEGAREVTRKAGIAPADLGQVIHGTTLATNALIERKGANTALITTRGFRDTIEMRHESRFAQYDLNLQLPEPLLPRNHRHVVTERVGAKGDVLIPLDEGEVEHLATRLEKAGYEAIAVGLLHSYANGTHERRVRDILAARLPGVMISLSSEVSPQMREYERFNTTIVNAYVQPLMRRYLDRLTESFAEIGADCPIYLMHSGGGIMALDTAANFPVRLVESGPAGGAVMAARLARMHRLGKVISFDMGGTTAKICLIRNGRPRTAQTFEVARTYRHARGSGMPISIPVIDMVEIGAGGGSLAHVDAMRQIRVGPQSAGSDPGPACYQRGGTRPAVTDADLLLGRLAPDGFARGSIRLDRKCAETALDTGVGRILAMSAAHAARAVVEVVDENMANAARVHAAENGEDLGDYVMVAFGGAGPIHAARLCAKLGITRCLVPTGAGVGSAIGFLQSPYSFEATRSRVMRMDDFDAVQASEIFAALREEAEGFVRNCSADAPVVVGCKIFMRYVGQGWDIEVPLTEEAARTPGCMDILARFESAYRALFERTVDGPAIEITTWSVTAITTRSDTRMPAATPESQHDWPATGVREMLEPDSGARTRAAVHALARCPAGGRCAGPAVITDDGTSIIVPDGWQARALADGSIEFMRAATPSTSDHAKGTV